MELDFTKLPAVVD